MPAQLQYPFTMNYFLFLPNLLTFRTKGSLQQHLSHSGPYIQTMYSAMLDDYLTKDRHTYSSRTDAITTYNISKALHIRMTLIC